MTWATVEGETEKLYADVEGRKDSDVFKSRQDGALSPGLMGGVHAHGRELKLDDLRDPFQSKPFQDLVIP